MGCRVLKSANYTSAVRYETEKLYRKRLKLAQICQQLSKPSAGRIDNSEFDCCSTLCSPLQWHWAAGNTHCTTIFWCVDHCLLFSNPSLFHSHSNFGFL